MLYCLSLYSIFVIFPVVYFRFLSYLVADVAAPGDCRVKEEAEEEQAVGEHSSLK